MPNATEPEWLTERLTQTIALATAEVHAGGIPFAGLVADDTATVLGTGVNQVRAHRDPPTKNSVLLL
ncbi:hypothetical protein [Streptosporangium canum]|uniref:hypothetical protein n=1 Tax=Streptosporangium canum TaxID=324952 RepID=UPI003441EB7D